MTEDDEPVSETAAAESSAFEPSADSPGRALLKYTIYRFLVFAIALVVLYLLGARSYLLVALAIVISGLISLVVLDRQRDGIAPMVKKFTSRINDRIESGKRKEDAASDATFDSSFDSASDADDSADRPHPSKDRPDSS